MCASRARASTSSGRAYSRSMRSRTRRSRARSRRRCSEPVFAWPVVAWLLFAEPVFAWPLFAEPVFAWPVFAWPVFSESVFAGPFISGPVVSEPVFPVTLPIVAHPRRPAGWASPARRGAARHVRPRRGGPNVTPGPAKVSRSLKPDISPVAGAILCPTEASAPPEAAPVRPAGPGSVSVAQEVTMSKHITARSISRYFMRVFLLYGAGVGGLMPCYEEWLRRVEDEERIEAAEREARWDWTVPHR